MFGTPVGTGIPHEWDQDGTAFSLSSGYYSVQESKNRSLLSIAGFKRDFSGNLREFEEVHHGYCRHGQLLVSD